MRAAVVPIVFVVLVGAVIGGLILLRGDPEPAPRNNRHRPDPDTGLPASLAGEGAEEFLELFGRVRDSLGRDAEALSALRATMPVDPAARVEWLRFLRPGFDLAIRSGDASAGTVAMAAVAGSIDEPGGPVHAFVTGPAFRDTWVRALQADPPAVRVAAVRLLGRLGGEACRTRVVPRLEDPDPEVRRVAVMTYVDLQGGVARLVARYDTEKDDGVRLSLLIAFATSSSMRRPEALRIEARALRSGTNAERIQAMENLGAWRDQDLLDGILDNLGSSERAVRKSALLTLERLRDRRCLERLRAHAEKESDEELAAQARRVIAGLE